jgi:hypothetical protein
MLVPGALGGQMSAVRCHEHTVPTAVGSNPGPIGVVGGHVACGTSQLAPPVGTGRAGGVPGVGVCRRFGPSGQRGGVLCALRVRRSVLCAAKLVIAPRGRYPRVDTASGTVSRVGQTVLVSQG